MGAGAGSDRDGLSPESAAAEARTSAGLPQTGYSRLILFVDDVDESCSRIGEAGGKAGTPTFVSWLGVRIAFAKDPDGYVLELIEGDIEGV